MRNLWLMIRADFLNLLKNPMWVFYATAFPILMTVILGYLTEKSYGSEITSFDYYGITMMLYAVLNGGMTSANAFLEERIKKPNMRIIYAPGSPQNIYRSKVVASFGFALLFHLADILVLYTIFHVTVASPLYLLVLLVLTELFAATLGITMCCIFKSEAMTNQIQSIVINLFAILGGVLFSLDGYGAAARKISMLSPVKWVVKAVFQIIYDRNLHLFLPSVLVLTGSILGMLLICRITFRKEDCIC